MKIAFLSQISIREFAEYFPGVELPEGYKSEIFVPLIRKYLELGHEVVICTLNVGSIKSKVYYSDKLTVFAAGCLVKPKLRAFNNFEYEINQMVKFFRKNPCDVYHAHWTYEFAEAALRINPEKAIITIHDWPELIYNMFKDYYRKKRLELSNRVFLRGEIFTTVSPYIADMFNEKYKNKGIKVIPNYTQFTDEELYVAAQYSLESPVLISINTFDPRKNTTTLIEAFQLIKKRIPNASLKLFGHGHGKNEDAEKWAIKHGISIDGIEFVGAVPHSVIVNELKKATVLIHPSLEESFGLTLIEAMFCKTPVIGGANSGAVPWVLDNGNAGLLVDVTSAEEISKNVIALLNDESQYEKLIDRGLNRVKDFSLDSIAEQYLEKYRNTISER